MADASPTPTPSQTTNRYREIAEPQGFMRVVRVRVVETIGPIPAGCELTTDEPHDWREQS